MRSRPCGRSASTHLRSRSSSPPRCRSPTPPSLRSEGRRLDPYPEGDPGLDPYPEGDPGLDPYPEGDPGLDLYPKGTPAINLNGIDIASALVVCAHPDDAEFGAGGTIARMAAEGVAVTICVVSHGAMGSNDPAVAREDLIAAREVEQRAAAAAAGVGDVVFLGYEDGYLEDSHEIRRDIIREIRRRKPEAVLGPDPSTFFVDQRYLNHPDHRAVGLAFSAAVNPGATTVPIYRAELYDQGFEPHPVKICLLMTPMSPDYFVDVSAHMDTKIRALRAHVSQLGAYKGLDDRVREMAKLTAERGATGTEYAEAFKAFFFEQRPSGQGEVMPGMSVADTPPGT